MQNYWHKQAADKPLFEDMLWSRPENKNQAGKLLIIGGNQYGFAAAAEAYGTATKSGLGTARVLLPLAVKKIAGGLLPELEYAASTPSGSFAKSAFGEFIEQSRWADGVLLAGDLGRNSETAILLENFLSKYIGMTTLTKDACDYVLETPKIILERKNTLLVITMAQLQKLAMGIKYNNAFTVSMDLLRLVNELHEFTLRYPAKIIIKHLDQLVVAQDGQISSTRLFQKQPIWRVKTAATAAVWWLQNPSKPFEALTTSVGLIP
jgi:ADP-dependent NAD(P)H-hydrate dehydratase / NAD(P)H-hydrate epimerase